jgi:hypothetical protein
MSLERKRHRKMQLIKNLPSTSTIPSSQEKVRTFHLLADLFLGRSHRDHDAPELVEEFVGATESSDHG